jgi:hypothetical protein
MKLKAIIPAFILIISLFSCQKEYVPSGVDPNPTPDPIADSNYLDKIFYIDSSSIQKENEVLLFNYDNANRVISIYDSIGISPQTNLTINNKYLYYYNNSDTLPYKTINVDYFDSSLPPDTTVKFHFYDGTGQKIKDSILYSEYNGSNFTVWTDIQLYSYGLGKIYGEEFMSYTNSTNYDLIRRDTGIINSYGDIVNNQKYVYDPVTMSSTLFENSTHEFDNHPSPFAKLSNFKTWAIFPNGDDLAEDLPQYHQNITYILNDYLGGGVHQDIFDIRGTFTYNQRGYPVSYLRTSTDGYTRANYTYKVL